MASSGVLVVQAELVKCCRGSWEQTDIEARTFLPCRGVGPLPPPLVLQT